MNDTGEKRGPGRPRKFGPRRIFNFRISDDVRERVAQAAQKGGRSISEEIEHRLGQSFEWERALGDLEAFRAHLAQSKERLEQEEREMVRASLYRKGWGKIYDPAVPGGVQWLPPGTHNIPQSGFEPWDAPPAPTALPPAIHEAVRSAVLEILQELSKKKPGDEPPAAEPPRRMTPEEMQGLLDELAELRRAVAGARPGDDDAAA